MGSPRVSIVIACRNEARYIGNAVHALLSGTIHNIEVLVVDGRSTDGTGTELAKLAACDSRIRIIDNPEQTTPVAFNRGIRESRGEFVAVCGAHSVPAPDWVEQNLAALAEHPEAVGVGGVLETVGESGVGRVIAAVMSSRFGVGNARFRIGGEPGYVDTVVFGCYRRQAFERGLFDEQLATNQDDEFNTRLIARGEKLWFEPKIRCRYFCRSNWFAMLRQYWRYGRYKFLVFVKAGRIGSWRQLVPSAFIAFLVFFPFRCLRRAGLAAYLIAGSAAAFGALRRLRWRTPLFLPIAASLHFAYGFGFWIGLIRDGLARA